MLCGFRHKFVPHLFVSLRAFCGLFLCVSCSLAALAEATLRENGRAYVRLGSVADMLGMQSVVLPQGQHVELRSQWSRLRFARDSRLLHYNEMPVYLGFSVRQKQGHWWLSLSDLNACLKPLLTPKLFGAAPGLRTIVLDPGHGGKDQGAENTRYGLREQALNLQVALGLAQRLNAAGFRVALTRRDDRYVSLGQRTRMANQAKADLFLSIHFNAAQSKTASGLETFILTPRYQPSTKDASARASDKKASPGQKCNPWNVVLGHALQAELVAATGEQDRGLKRARFSVLRSIECPAALVELGFLSHAPTASRLRSNTAITVLIDALFAGVVRYQARLQGL